MGLEIFAARLDLVSQLPGRTETGLSPAQIGLWPPGRQFPAKDKHFGGIRRGTDEEKGNKGSGYVEKRASDKARPGGKVRGGSAELRISRQEAIYASCDVTSGDQEYRQKKKEHFGFQRGRRNKGRQRGGMHIRHLPFGA